jgi:hypothetical protein
MTWTEGCAVRSWIVRCGQASWAWASESSPVPFRVSCTSDLRAGVQSGLRTNQGQATDSLSLALGARAQEEILDQ